MHKHYITVLDLADNGIDSRLSVAVTPVSGIYIPQYDRHIDIGKHGGVLIAAGKSHYTRPYTAALLDNIIAGIDLIAYGIGTDLVKIYMIVGMVGYLMSVGSHTSYFVGSGRNSVSNHEKGGALSVLLKYIHKSCADIGARTVIISKCNHCFAYINSPAAADYDIGIVCLKDAVLLF